MRYKLLMILYYIEKALEEPEPKLTVDDFVNLIKAKEIVEKILKGK